MSEIHNFPPISTQEWVDKVVADLKGADFEKKLVWRSPEGFSVQPFYRQEDLEKLSFTDNLPGSFPYVRGTKKKGNDWYVRQDIKVVDAAEANKKALDILNKGITSLGFCLNKKVEYTTETIATLLSGIALDCIEINFSVPASKQIEFTELFVAYVKSKNYSLVNIKGSLNYDLLGRLVKKGRSCGGDLVETSTALINATKELPNFRVITVNAKYFTNAGAYITQELAYALNMANEYMAQLTESGVAADEVANNIRFSFGIGSNYFMEIAKFRAARMMWAKIVEAYKPTCNCGSNDIFCQKAAKMEAHAETTMWNKTIYDTHANMLRSQTEAMSAAIGGVDSITVLPYDACYKESSDFSERIARNQQLLLKEESHFDKITDPAGGSYYIETLTNSIAEKAWSLFVEVEDKGGFMVALKEGFVQAQVTATADKRRAAIATRKENLLGTNQFPNFTETKLQDVNDNACGCGCKCGCEGKEKEVEPLTFGRGAEEFEALRMGVEAREKQPTVFLLKTGNVTFRQARAQFVANFFGCAGFKILEDTGYKTATEGAEAALKSGAEIIVICSSDEEYETNAPEAFNAIGDKAVFVVAGAPACSEALAAQGITNFVNVRSNVLGELKRYVSLV